MAKTTTVKAVAAKVAKAKKIEASEAAKLVRSRIRSTNSELLTKEWPQLKKNSKVPHDGNRYPDMPERLGNALIRSMTKGGTLQDALKASRARTAKATPSESTTTTPEVTTEA